jgi:hypothetical protein
MFVNGVGTLLGDQDFESLTSVFVRGRSCLLNSCNFWTPELLISRPALSLAALHYQSHLTVVGKTWVVI